MKQRKIKSRSLDLSNQTFEYQTRSQSLEEVDYAKMRVGLKTLDDAILKLSAHEKVNSNYADKAFILRSINNREVSTLREISEYYYEASGIYQRLCKYLAYLYKCDWVVSTYINKEGVKEEKVLKDFSKVLNYLEESDIKRLYSNIALNVIKSGSYYGYLVFYDNRFTIQQLPSAYCRNRYFRGTDPVVEFNLKYFDDKFTTAQHRLKVLSIFPKEIQKAYVLYKENKLVGDYPGDENGWYMLDPDLTVKFNLNGSDLPTLVSAIPSIIDLDQAQELDRKKMMQQLLKIIIQKMPLDKNGDLVFDVDEARDIHNNAVSMLKKAVGVDVLTTFAEIQVADMKDRNSTTTTDDLAKVERTVYNNLGVSQNLFNTDGNMSLEKSIANDEALMRDLILQFQNLLNRVTKKFSHKSQYDFKANILETTIYNYKELSKMYKEQTQIGFSKLLPQVALGHSQSMILASIQFENDVLHLSDIMIPPMSSNTMSGKNNINQQKTETKSAGRPEKADEEKSDKTIKNRESMS